MQFIRFLYYENLQIVHLFDTMHIEKNIIEFLWRILDGRTDKDRIGKICCDIQEANHSLQSVIINSNGDGRQQNISLPWCLTEQQKNIVKEVIRKIRFPMGFSSNIKNILMKKGDFGGVKTHEWHTFIKVIIFIRLYIIYLLVCTILLIVFSYLEINNNYVFFDTVCSTFISPRRL